MTEMRKITAFVPAKLLQSAQEHTKKGIAETLRIALEKMAHEEFYQGMMALRGKLKLDIDLEQLRKDREFDEHGNVIDRG